MTGLAEKLRAAWKKRQDLPEIADGSTDVFRVCDGAADGVPDMIVDSFAGRWLVQTRGEWEGPFPDAGELPGCRAVWWKQLHKSEKGAPVRVSGGDADPRFLARELGLSYHIHFDAGYSQGIFPDQRVQRQRLRALAIAKPGMRLLNLFAYTCAFSVVAAAAGAQTESVDLSKHYLDWGQENFAANNLPVAGHFFCRGDSFDWLRRLEKKGRRYDVVVLDPPTFSRNDTGGVWQVERDFSSLAAGALRLLEDGGMLLCSTNSRAISPTAFKAMIERGAATAGRTILSWETGRMPGDFPGEAYLKAIWARCR